MSEIVNNRKTINSMQVINSSIREVEVANLHRGGGQLTSNNISIIPHAERRYY